MKHCSATSLTISSVVARASALAFMSRNNNSSAPWASYTRAAVMGLPVSRKSRNRRPFTQRPSRSSSDGIRRFFSAIRGSEHLPGQHLVVLDVDARGAADHELEVARLDAVAGPLGGEHVALDDRSLRDLGGRHHAAAGEPVHLA